MTNNQLKILDSLKYKIERLTPVEWGEMNRSLSKKDSRFHGKLSYRLTPYWIKVVNSFMPENPVQVISVMKGSQIGFSSAGIYTILGWIMSESPYNTLFITENDAKLKDQMQGPINSMINSSGLADKVGSHNLREREAKGRRKKATGDTLTGIDFGDGFLYTLSGQVVSSLSSWNIKYGIYDEVERWKGQYKSAGDFTGLVDPRHKSYGNERKLLYGSTPEIKQTSNIEPLYEIGDQQKYNIPCLHCGTMHPLEWDIKLDNNERAGISYKRDLRGNYIDDSVTYVCPSCGKDFKETHKYDMYEETYAAYKSGSDLVCDWVPTSEPKLQYHESYHISSMYSPPGFYTWNDMARKWCAMHPLNGSIDVGKKQTFYNQELGLTWEEMGRTPKANKLQKNTRNYNPTELPVDLIKEDGNGHVLFLTCGCDLNGQMTGDREEVLEDDVRLDYEIVAWTEKGPSYSIDAGSIGTFQNKRIREDEGKDRKKYSYRLHAENSVWNEFAEIIQKEYGGLNILLTGVDVGNWTEYAVDFVQQSQVNGLSVIGVKGDKPDAFRMTEEDKQIYKKSKKQDNLYLMNVNSIKDDVARNMNLDMDGEKQPANFMNFPIPNDGKYTYKNFFSHYEGEHKKLKKNANNIEYFLWERKVGKMNHFWDCRIYNDGLKKIIQDMVCKKAEVETSYNNMTTVIVNVGYENLGILVYHNVMGYKI